MSPLAYIANRLAMACKRRQLRSIDEFIFLLEDQVLSGQQSLKALREKRSQVHAEIFLLEPADEIVRRSGAGA